MSTIKTKVLDNLNICKNATIVSFFGTDAITSIQAECQQINSENSKHIVFFYDCSFGEDYFEDALEAILYKYTKKDWGAIKQVYYLVDKGYKISVVLSEYKFAYKKIGKLASFISEINKEKTSLITILLAAEYYSPKLNIYTNPPMISKRLFIWPLMDIAESIKYIKGLATELNIKIANKEIQQIIEFGGGFRTIYSNLIRLKSKYKNILEAISSNESLNISNIVWNYLSEKEKYTISVLFFSNETNDGETLAYLKELRLINQENKVVGGWLKTLLMPEKLKKFYLKSKKLYWAYYELESILTSDEYAILIKLFYRKSTTVTKEELFKIKYGSTCEYTEGALNKFISRLNTKLNKIGVGSDSIKTVWGVGYKLY